MAKLDDEIDALFKLPLTEFIVARKTLAARLKKEGRQSEAESVKALAKPSISAWTVNQLYWEQREAFDELVATGQRLRKAQTSGKMVNIREALDARRDALANLSDLATALLRDGGHNPSLDTLRHITATLEAMSAYTSLVDGPTPGRLTQDVDPPGFDSFASFTPTAGQTKRGPEPRQAGTSKERVTAATKTRQKASANAEVSRREDTRQARINAAKASLQHARKSLTTARATAQSLEAAQKKAEAAAKEAAKQAREAEERYKKASAAHENATERARSIAAEFAEATKAWEEAKRTVEKATMELERSFRESPGTRRKEKHA